MSVGPGSRLGHYEIVSSLGAGAMGSVYRAKDHKLGREIAIKLLHDEVSRDPERLARFRREARLLASLSHPNIATVYGFEEEGNVNFLAMELIEGETLAEVIERRPLSSEEAAPLFVSLAEGLAAAHDKGVVHRDLKPANVKVTSDGRAKILDFGLAKATTRGVHDSDLATSGSPTLTSDDLQGTREGQILGTISYMAPEQATGRSVDGRTDIWALGCCLFETLSGHRPFEADNSATVLSLILQRDPDWAKLPTSVPQTLRRLLERTLAKDPQRRWQSARDVAIELEAIRTEEAQASDSGRLRPQSETSRRRRDSRPILIAAAALVAVALGIVIGSRFEGERRDGATEGGAAQGNGDEQWTTATLDLAPDVTSLALSPDGRRLVYGGDSNAEPLYLRELSSLDSVPLPGTEDAVRPAAFSSFSLSGDRYLFTRQDQSVRSLSLDSGAFDEVSAGSILAFHDDHGALYTTVFDGARFEWELWLKRPGEPDPVSLGKQLMGYLEGLALERGVLFAWGGTEVVNAVAQIYRIDLATRERVAIGEGERPTFLAPDVLVYYRDGEQTLVAVRLDQETLLPIGEHRIVERDVAASVPFLNGIFSISRSGDLVYRRKRPGSKKLVWVDRDGSSLGDVAPETNYFAKPQFSPDGRQLSVTAYGLDPGKNAGAAEYFTARQMRLDLETSAWSSGIQSEHRAGSVLWLGPDSRNVVFSSTRDDGVLNLYLQSADGSGNAQRIAPGERAQDWLDATPDGRLLFYNQAGLLGFFMLNRETSESTHMSPEANVYSAAVHPSGRYIAYANATVDQGIWIQRVPDAGQRELGAPIRLTQGPDKDVRWSPSGDELFFRSATHFTGIPVRVTDGDLVPARPQELFEDRFRSEGNQMSWAIHPDGRFLVLEPATADDSHEYVYIQNWRAKVESVLREDI